MTSADVLSPAEAASGAVLEAAGLTVRYGGVTALNNVDIEVGPGELVGLIGPNGAGKTTFIDAVTGFTTAAGVVRLDGADVAGVPPHARAARGIARTWQAAELFDDLTVRQNLAVATGRRPLRRAVADALRGRSADPPEVTEALDRLGIADLADRSPAELGQGQRKLVAVARALAARPRVLLLDEPAAGLDTAESEVLGARLRAVADAGTAMLLVDHDMGLVLGVCDRVAVLEFGRVIACGSPDEVRTDPAVVEAYLGAAGRDLVPVSTDEPGGRP